ncbi:MAG: lipoprotein-releasing ABC transporter permease subunit [Paraperlucidibaca sp.]|jgi:lipoprotein-releasing system permease protein|uniref:lipoprotein-releasing ABC transporter permease subunit n=1 Tax=Paraperlucidibaca sp. TaxID=2708021 RepID=UPI001B697212|nr:lipoprotein-releasing ABC transporter permease subunit [Paraperlucidibaca sp.]MBQ0722190.1 lipoprotein-releasing ABC transporter permease subunit [Paraperlucidibaca sp.]MBQ0841995.1 lipoprotein-releasing ABC transporter permease subunit [Paraperlucidibaca sp.]
MYKPLSVFIGLRYTRARRRDQFISFMSLSSMIGLMLGVAVLITVLSVMNGFDRELKQRILGMVSQSTIHATEPVQNWRKLVQIAEASPGVTAAAPMSQVQGMLTANGQVNGAVITGIAPEFEAKVSILPDFMTQGQMSDLTDGSYGIVLGQQLADVLGVRMGDSVTLVLPEATLSAAGVIPRFKRFNVVGVFKVGAEVDGILAYVHYADAGRLLRIGDRVQGLRLKVDDLFAVRATNERLLATLPPYFYASDWTQTQGSLFNAIKMEKAMMSLLLLLIVAVAAFNIVSSLVMVVNDKKSDIAILRTLGATPGMIQRIFLVQGTAVGLGGTIAGVGLGILLSLTVSDIAAGYERLMNVRLFDAYFVNYLPTQLDWFDVTWVGLTAFILSFLATIYPARQAGRIQPAEALRHE